MQNLNKTNDSRWELFSHDADMGIRGMGTTPDEAFEQAGLALTGVITDPEKVKTTETRTIKCQAPSLDILFYDWINCLVYEISKDKLLFSKFEVQINNLQLTAKVWGEPVDVQKHAPAVEVKGATFTQLKAEQSNGIWTVQCVVDV